MAYWFVNTRARKWRPMVEEMYHNITAQSAQQGQGTPAAPVQGQGTPAPVQGKGTPAAPVQSQGTPAPVQSQSTPV